MTRSFFSIILSLLCLLPALPCGAEYLVNDALSNRVPQGGTVTGGGGSGREIYAAADPGVVVITMHYNGPELRDKSGKLLLSPGQYLGHGSGFFVKENGYILTNSHVVDTSEFGKIAGYVTFQVILKDGRKLRPQIVKRDPALDLALLKVSGGPYPALPLGSAADLKVGDPLFIIGTPIRLEFTHSLTSGIVSGMNRTNGWIQTSAILHGGNSGGPVLNNSGQVVGVAVAVAKKEAKEKALIQGRLIEYITSQEAYGISYIIPIDHAANLLRLTY